nr:hypothetical protein [Hyphomonas sp. Mor2]
MNSRARFWMMTLAVFVISCAIILLTAYSVGADPLHPRSRHIWALSLIAAAYASIRVAMIIGRFLDAREEGDAVSTGSGLPFFGKKEHAIDRRLAERRARVEAAQKKTEDNIDSKKDAGDE